jgi:cytosine/adenosine deaminase-related metal-dependent hydrolase
LGDQIGSIAPGMQADIIAFDGDRLKDVNAARHAVFVMKADKVFENRCPATRISVRSGLGSDGSKSPSQCSDDTGEDRGQIG